MTQMVIHHKVKDYDAWRPGYDNHAPSRKAAGISGGEVFRKADDPNDVVILFEVADEAQARSWAQSDDLRSAMSKAGVVGQPRIDFIH
ncbi:cyclase [Caulobacter sp. 17J80-11]|uniref:cyclase n=1 Tax=Caulobacter sp. 17J80-11 TaxID=2763502 RepID=UPI001653D8D7|nr:cyclase [Caulobacter sp. 17J80-11]MBC6982552.1 cyclase [Caulobacter sp. 17J80-11]